MARAGTPLDTGDALPKWGFDTLAHGRIEVPEWFAGHYGVLLIYRGHW
ncbi:MAG: hypothetical protein AAGA48_16555 [Myxococcota bacterium]